MTRMLFGSVLTVAVVGVIAMSTLTLFYVPQAVDLNAEGSSEKTSWIACPWPPCMMPCAYPPQPEVLCKYKNEVVETSFACCCCGGGSAKYKPL